ncbi:hypothetical protein HMPREF9682_00677 [Streptococcus intermedius F0395]|nr:hypothetical protein HMPREF9682_00677 [Streptococcus intermedius F0395]
MISLLKEHFKANHINAFNLYLNPMMLQQYNQYWMHIGDDIKTSNSPAIMGDGILLGQSVGTDLVGLDFYQIMLVSDPITGASG